MTIRYCSPEWLEESAKVYRSIPRFEEALKKVTTKIFYRITAEPAWGIEKDIVFGAVVEAGKLLDLNYYSESEAKKTASFILAATPQVWKGIIRKEKKFITEFMLGKVTLEEGSKPGLLKITPYANHFVDALAQFEIQFPDEMSVDELEAFRVELSSYRENSGV